MKASVPRSATPHLSRRQLLRIGAAGTAASLAAACSTSAPRQSAAAPATQPSGPVRPFPLTQVRLLPGPFKDAQQRDATYLLSLEPDRMLHNFRVNAGLPLKAPVYGGWESVATWADIRAHGHTLGHYLSACAMMAASTGDPRFADRVNYIVGELQACQRTAKTGGINAFPDNLTQIDNAVAGRRIVGVPWYTLHKIYAGLRDAHLFTGSAAALDVLTQCALWAGQVTAPMTDEQFQRMLRVEHGGMNEVLADLYALTNDPRHLALAKRFCDESLLTPLSENRDTLDNLHSNTQIPKVIGFQRLFELTGDERYGNAAAFFWQTVVGHRSFATGGNGDNEHFFPITDFAKHVTSPKTMETCCSYNMLKLSRALFTCDPKTLFADYYEQALYNAILASQDPDSGMMTYFQPLKPGYLKLFCTPTDSFWCCTGTGMENHSKYGDSIYFHTDDTLFVNLFIPSTLAWPEKGLTLTQTTHFPDEPRTHIAITAKRPIALTLSLRHPYWCDTANVLLNGKPIAASTTRGSPIPITRTWRNGDKLELQLPMTLRAVPLPGAPAQAAIAYGPIVLAGQLGNQGITPGSDLIVNERTYGQMLNEPISIPVLKSDFASATAAMHRDGAERNPLAFTADTSAGPIRLLPFYRTVHERYVVYWQTPSA